MIHDWLSDQTAARVAIVLGHFLWQGAIIALIAMTVSTLLRTSAARYATLATALAAMMVCPFITFAVMSIRHSSDTAAPIAMDRATISESRESTTTVAPSVMRDPIVVPPIETSASPSAVSVTVVELYFIGLGIMGIRLALALRQAHRLRSDALPLESAALHREYEEIVSRMAMRVPPALAIGARITTPMVVGWVRPMILLPISLTTGWPVAQLRALLVHELAHIRRKDPIVNFLQLICESLLFFHPAVWFVSNRLREERENCCDDLAIEMGVDRVVYAHALARVVESTVSNIDSRVALAATTAKRPSQLRRRLSRLLAAVQGFREAVEPLGAVDCHRARLRCYWGDATENRRTDHASGAR
jgi:beta-lactamase regulating signal transducer with metallopeptidase domain